MISIVGNDMLKTTVKNFIKEKRIPHAILIEGDYGTGKHTLAKYLTEAIVCSEEGSPCGNCHNCHLAKINSHPDITVVSAQDGKKSITVSQIREVRNDAYIKPHQAQKRVFVIDGADSMNEQSQNALLKVLEEPPSAVMFILIAENKSALLDTIISRCVCLTLNTPEFSQGFDYIKSTTNFQAELIKEALENEKNNIGKALNALRGISSSKTESSAKDFLKFAIDGDQFSMLKTVMPYSKSRVDADNFIKDLKYLIAQKIRKSPNSSFSKPLMSIYTVIPQFEDSLLTNINLNLLFCSLTTKMIELVRRNK